MANKKCCFINKEPKEVDDNFCSACQEQSGYWCAKAKCPRLN
jgi:hypothetical protein